MVLALVGGAVPTSLHQGAVGLFRDDPALVFDLLRSPFGVELPPLTSICDRHGTLDRFAPCFGDTGELRPDLVVTGEASDPEAPPAAIAAIVEVQRRVDPRKRWRISVYWALVAELLRRPTAVLLVALTEAVSRWARSLAAAPLSLGGLFVLDRHSIPRVTDLGRARQRPALALLSALVHATHRDLAVLRTALTATLELADARRWRYACALLSAVDDQARDLLLGALAMDEREQLTELELNSIAYHDGLRAGEREGRLAGEREGRLAGEREGRLAGEREGRRLERVELLLTVLELRGLEIDAAREAELRACRDLEQLARWTERAKQVDDAAAVFG